MKNICWIIAGIILLCTGCKEQDNVYKEYIVPNGIVYPEKVNAPIAYSGYEKVKLSWLRGADANVVRSRIFWNNYTDSVDMDIPATGDTINCMITPLEESTYSFMIYTYDRHGNKSIPVEVPGTVYGDVYQSRLINRGIESAESYTDGELVINWGPADITNGAVFTELRYLNRDGDSTTVRVASVERTSSFPDYTNNSELNYHTVFVPDSLCIDTFYTSKTKQVVGIFPRKVDRTGWVVTASSMQNDANSPDKAIDGNTATQWHSLPAAKYPHWIAFDMGKVIGVDKVILTMRSASPTNTFKDFTIQGSMDGTTWTDYGNFVFQPLALTPQSFTIEGNPAIQHIRIYATNSHANPYAVLAEFELTGYSVE